jgi:hypothetical protein
VVEPGSSCNNGQSKGKEGPNEEQASYAPRDLKNCNNFTLLSRMPGVLNCEAYLQYLTIVRHVKSPLALEL